jgi:centromere protein C
MLIIYEDTAPGPADFLYRSDTRRSPYLPPPVARSPRKSGLGGSPRRTPGLRSSPIAQDERRSSSPSTLPQRKGRSGETARPPLNDRRPNTATAPIVRQKNKEFDASGDFSDNENNPVHDDDDIQDDESAFENDIAGDVDVHVNDDYGDDSDDSIEDVGAGHADMSEQDSPSVHASNSRTINRRSASIRRSRDTDEEDNDAPAEPAEPPPGNKLKRGRPGKSANAQQVDNRPAKKPKPSKAAPSAPPEPLDPELEKVVENHVSRTGPLKGRSLYILKRETPSEEQSTHTRSGRVSVRPLAYWRNERCVYGDGEANLGQRYPLSTIKEIIRTEELQPENGKKKRKKGKQSKKQGDESGEDPGVADEWETKEGVLYGYAKKWDTERQTVSKEEETLGMFSLSDIVASTDGTEIAYASNKVETREVKDSTFRVAKLLSYSFIGSGIVEIPPKGVKKPKNSKRMHMVFYVSHGRVQVDMNGVQFTAGKGCVFQVPRGEFFSSTSEEVQSFDTI